MRFREALGEVIREQRLAKDLSLRDVSRRGFVSYSFLNEVERGEKECSSDYIEAIANGLDVSTHSLIIEAGYRMSEWEVPDTPESLFVRSADWIGQYSDLGN